MRTAFLRIQTNTTFHPANPTTSYIITLEMQYVIVSVSGFILFVISVIVLMYVFCNLTETIPEKPSPAFHIDIDIHGPPFQKSKIPPPLVKKIPPPPPPLVKNTNLHPADKYTSSRTHRKIQPLPYNPPLTWLDEDYEAPKPKIEPVVIPTANKQNRSSLVSQLFLPVSDKESVKDESYIRMDDSFEGDDTYIRMDDSFEGGDSYSNLYKDTSERLHYYTRPHANTLLSNPHDVRAVHTYPMKPPLPPSYHNHS